MTIIDDCVAHGLRFRTQSACHQKAAAAAPIVRRLTTSQQEIHIAGIRSRMTCSLPDWWGACLQLSGALLSVYSAASIMKRCVLRLADTFMRGTKNMQEHWCPGRKCQSPKWSALCRAMQGPDMTLTQVQLWNMPHISSLLLLARCCDT